MRDHNKHLQSTCLTPPWSPYNILEIWNLYQISKSTSKWLSYLRNCMKTPIINWLFCHQIWINAFNFHHDERYWTDPWKYRPGRFLDSNGDVIPPDHINRKRYNIQHFTKAKSVGHQNPKKRPHHALLAEVGIFLKVVSPSLKTEADTSCSAYDSIFAKKCYYTFSQLRNHIVSTSFICHGGGICLHTENGNFCQRYMITWISASLQLVRKIFHQSLRPIWP